MMDFNEGWREWSSIAPPHGILLEFYRQTWPETRMCWAHEIDTEATTDGLYWRYTGIGAEKELRDARFVRFMATLMEPANA